MSAGSGAEGARHKGTAPGARLRLERAASGGAPAAPPPAGFSNYTSPVAYAGLQEGVWGLTVRAADRAGLVSESRRAAVAAGRGGVRALPVTGACQTCRTCARGREPPPPCAACRPRSQCEHGSALASSASAAPTGARLARALGREPLLPRAVGRGPCPHLILKPSSAAAREARAHAAVLRPC